ncbi:MAG: CoA-binding protein [Actinomycetota bacterium]
MASLEDGIVPIRATVVIGAKTLWLQEGIVSDDAARIAREGGLQVVMNRCIKKVRQEMKP